MRRQPDSFHSSWRLPLDTVDFMQQFSSFEAVFNLFRLNPRLATLVDFASIAWQLRDTHLCLTNIIEELSPSAENKSIGPP